MEIQEYNKQEVNNHECKQRTENKNKEITPERKGTQYKHKLKHNNTAKQQTGKKETNK